MERGCLLALATGTKLSWMAVLGKAKVRLDAVAALLISFRRSCSAMCGTRKCTTLLYQSLGVGGTSMRDWRWALD